MDGKRHVGSKPDIVRLGFAVAAASAQLVSHARSFYYAVVLSGHACPGCGGHLGMLREGLCTCAACARTFDPTVAFQACASCGGAPRVRIRRYACSRCGTEITSRFLFDGLVFDAAYFRAKMAASRARRQQRRRAVQTLLAGTRSGALDPGPAALDNVPDLVAGLDGLSCGGAPPFPLPARAAFDLERYETHVRAHLHAIPIQFDDVPPLSEKSPLDRIWRFIAILYLAQAGTLHVWQDGPTIWVMKHEADRERQAVFGEPEAADGVA